MTDSSVKLSAGQQSWTFNPDDIVAYMDSRRRPGRGLHPGSLPLRPKMGPLLDRSGQGGARPVIATSRVTAEAG